MDLRAGQAHTKRVIWSPLLAKGDLPQPLSTGEAVLGVALVLAGVLLAVVVAALNSR
jgi:hypothetical protein